MTILCIHTLCPAQLVQWWSSVHIFWAQLCLTMTFNFFDLGCGSASVTWESHHLKPFQPSHYRPMRLGRFLRLGRDGFVAVGHEHLRWNWQCHIEKANRLCCLFQAPYTNSKSQMALAHFLLCSAIYSSGIWQLQKSLNSQTLPWLLLWLTMPGTGKSPNVSRFSSQQSMLVPYGR